MRPCKGDHSKQNNEASGSELINIELIKINFSLDLIKKKQVECIRSDVSSMFKYFLEYAKKMLE